MRMLKQLVLGGILIASLLVISQVAKAECNDEGVCGEIISLDVTTTTSDIVLTVTVRHRRSVWVDCTIYLIGKKRDLPPQKLSGSGFRKRRGDVTFQANTIDRFLLGQVAAANSVRIAVTVWEGFDGSSMVGELDRGNYYFRLPSW